MLATAARQISDDDYTLLVVTLIDKPTQSEADDSRDASKWYMDRHAATLREMIRQQDRVGLLHLSFERKGNVDIFLPTNDAKHPRSSYCHPQLTSYLNWYPTFILVQDKNYFDRDSDLQVRVFNRTIQNGNYTPGKKAYVPANIIMWVSDEMDSIMEEGLDSNDEALMIDEDSWDRPSQPHDRVFAEENNLHTLLQGDGFMVDSL